MVLRTLGAAGHGRHFHSLLAGLHRSAQTDRVMKRISLAAIGSVAYKEFLHIYRDRRVLILLLILPPVFTLIFGHAFEVGDPTNVPALLIDTDKTPRSQR